jgi:hypothetical protein
MRRLRRVPESVTAEPRRVKQTSAAQFAKRAGIEFLTLAAHAIAPANQATGYSHVLSFDLYINSFQEGA